MAKSRLKLIEKPGMQRGKQYDVYLDGKVVAILSEQPGSDAFRFRLVNYPHNHSKMYGTERAALAAIEREVL
jgi:hypothetical protein